jgi:hypothetical protein
MFGLGPWRVIGWIRAGHGPDYVLRATRGGSEG